MRYNEIYHNRFEPKFLFFMLQLQLYQHDFFYFRNVGTLVGQATFLAQKNSLSPFLHPHLVRVWFINPTSGIEVWFIKPTVFVRNWFLKPYL